MLRIYSRVYCRVYIHVIGARSDISIIYRDRPSNFHFPRAEHRMHGNVAVATPFDDDVLLVMLAQSFIILPSSRVYVGAPRAQDAGRRRGGRGSIGR